MARPDPGGAADQDPLDRGLFGRPEATRWARTMFESVPAAMTLRDRSSALIWANAAYEELVGRSFEEMEGQGLSFMRGPLDTDEVLAKTEPSRFEQLRYTRPDGSEVLAEVVIQPLLGEDGETAFVLSVLTDVTDRVALAEQLSLDELAGTVGQRLAESTPDTHGAALRATLALIGGHFDALGVALTSPSGLHEATHEPLIWTDGGATEAELAATVNLAPRPSPAWPVAAQIEDRLVVSVPVVKGTDRGLLCLVLDRAEALTEREEQTLMVIARSLVSNGVRIDAQIYFRLAFDDAPVGISIRRMDSTLLAANQAYADFLGYSSPEEMVGVAAGAVLDDGSQTAAINIPTTVAELGAVQRLEVGFTRRDGTEVNGLVQAKVVEGFAGGEPLILSHVEDVTASAAQERMLKVSQRRFAGLVENSPAITLLTDAELRVTYVSPSIEQIGWTQADLLGASFHDMPYDVIGELAIRLDRVLVSAEPRQFEWTVSGPAGKRWLTVSAVPEWEDGEIQGLLVMAFDQSERRQSQAELAFQATHDALTGLANRSTLVEHLETQAGLKRSAVLFLDLDRFKVVNDSLGHAAGDKLLKGVAGRLRSAVRGTSLVARIGGDEFVIVADGARDPSAALAVADRVHERLAAPLEVGDHEIHVRASIGIAFGDEGGDPEILLANADAAMYRAKDQGRNRTQIYDTSRVSFPTDRIDIEADLRLALPRRELEVWYQPEIDLFTGQVLGAEALVRWRHPDRGIVPAAVFVPIAEECGLITEIGDWVVGEACRVARRWRDDPATENLVMRINLSAHQLSRSDAVSRVVAVLSETGVEPGRLCLEITETALMADAESSLTVLSGLRDLGLSLAIDDFGTGYSSLAYLKQFPVDILKIDRSFVSGLPEDGNDEAIVASIISLARAMDLDLVAEGVETVEQASALFELGCGRAQGYLFGRPAPLEDFSLIPWGSSDPVPFGRDRLGH